MPWIFSDHCFGWIHLVRPVYATPDRSPRESKSDARVASRAAGIHAGSMHETFKPVHIFKASTEPLETIKSPESSPVPKLGDMGRLQPSSAGSTCCGTVQPSMQLAKPREFYLEIADDSPDRRKHGQQQQQQHAMSDAVAEIHASFCAFQEQTPGCH